MYNKKLKNLDAAYKLIAYRIAKKYRTDVDLFIPESAFEHYYERQLQRDIQQPARPISVGDYDKKKSKCCRLTSVEKKDASEELEVDELALMKAKEETRLMYERLDVRYIIEQYEEDKKARDEANLISRNFLKQYYAEDLLDAEENPTEE